MDKVSLHAVFAKFHQTSESAEQSTKSHYKLKYPQHDYRAAQNSSNHIGGIFYENKL